MNIRTTLNAVALATAGLLSVPAQATCSESFNLGSMGPPGTTSLFNDFYAIQHFDDCYNFSLSNSADAFGLTLEWDASRTRDIDLTSVSLSGTGLPSAVVGSTPGWFSFDNLLAGTYQLIVSGNVTGIAPSGFTSDPVGYWGLMSTTRSTIAAPVPEPETYAMLALGLAIAAWTAKRGKAKS